MSTVLITGGAGFIGSHLADGLVAQGHQVTVLDTLLEPVHKDHYRAEYLPKNCGWKRGDCADVCLLHQHDIVFHLAARVGVGQSQYEIGRYVGYNVADTARMLQHWVDNPDIRPKRLIVASSMSIYGEGDRHFGISENAPIQLPNVYAQTKYDQERYCLLFGQAYDVPTTALRFFNVYGERQSLSNPYTGVAAMFAARLLHGKGGLIFEDGRQTRDFVSVHDIVQGLLLAMTAPEEVIAGEAFNIGTGAPHSLIELHMMIAEMLGVNIEPVITGQKRKGDIRHCFADITKAKQKLGYIPRVGLCEGMRQYAAWLAQQDVSQVLERVEVAAAELTAKGLLK